MVILLRILYTWTSRYKGEQGSIYCNAAYQGFPWYGSWQYVLPCTVWVTRGKAALYLDPSVEVHHCLYEYVRVCTGTYEYVRCTSIYYAMSILSQYILVCTSMYWYIIPYDYFIIVHSSMYEFELVLVHTCTDWFEVSSKKCKQVSNPTSSAYFLQILPLHYRCAEFNTRRYLTFWALYIYLVTAQVSLDLEADVGSTAPVPQSPRPLPWHLPPKPGFGSPESPASQSSRILTVQCAGVPQPDSEREIDLKVGPGINYLGGWLDRELINQFQNPIENAVIQHSLSEHLKCLKSKTWNDLTSANLFFSGSKMCSSAKRVEQSLGYWYLSKMEWFCLRLQLFSA